MRNYIINSSLNMPNKFREFFNQVFTDKKPSNNSEPKKDLIPFSASATYKTPVLTSTALDLMGLYQKNGWVYACVNKIAQEAASIDINLYKKNKDGEIEKVENHPVLDLLDRVNPYMTFHALKQTTFSYQQITGSAFWWLVKNDSGKEILEIYPWLNPANMKVLPDPEKFISGYQYQIPGGTFIKFEPEDIIYFKTFDPLDPYVSTSPLKASQLEILNDIEAKDWNYAFFRNSARPDGVLEMDGALTPEQGDRIKENWLKNHGSGNQKEHSIAIIGKGKYKDIGYSQKDMDFSSLLKSSRDQILAFYGVPKTVLGITEDVNYANAEQTKKAFLEFTIVPIVINFVEMMNEFLLPQFDNADELFFDYENPINEDVELDLKRYDSGIRNGWLSPNEVRAMQGLEPFEGGDEIGRSTQGNDGEIFTENVGKSKVVKKIVPNIKPKKKSRKQLDIERLKQLAMKDKNILDKLSKISKKKKLKQVSKVSLVEKDLEARWRSKIALTNKQEIPFQNQIIREFTRQEKTVLESLRKKKIQTVEDVQFEFNVEKEVKIVSEHVAPMMLALAFFWGQKGNEEINLPLDDFRVTPSLIKWSKTYSKKMATSMNQTTLDKLKKHIETGLNKGEGLPKIESRIKGIFEEGRNVRSKVMARTEVSRSVNEGRIEAWEQSGIVEKKRWVTAGDERVCDYCGPMEGKTINLRSNFFKKGDEFLGNSKTPLKLDYDSVPGNPLHANCRCDLVPIQ